VFVCALALTTSITFAGPFSPAADEPGSTAVANSDLRIVAWASQVKSIVRGPRDINNPAGSLASFGSQTDALGPAEGTSTNVVSLGDAGSITLGFPSGVGNGPGPDFAIFENSFGDTFLELGFVEVSSDDVNFFRFASTSLTPTTTQLGAFDTIDPTDLNNLAGSFRQGFGTPFDLAELAGTPGLNVNSISSIRVADVVGRITPAPGNPGWSPSVDSAGRLINDPYSTVFASGGFDLDGVGVINVAIPEPGLIVGVASLLVVLSRRGRRS